MRRLVAALIVLAGCGSGTGRSEPPSLIGSWAATQNTCAIGYTFASGQRYEIDTACPLTGGTIGLDAQTGTYAQTETQIDFSPLEATCSGTSKQTYFLGYSLTGGRLLLTATNGSAALVPITPSGSALSTFGCWTPTGFVPGPLAPL